jgi:hypothetical protein
VGRQPAPGFTLTDADRIEAGMPVLSKGQLKIDYADEGQGEPIMLMHSSVSDYQSNCARVSG